MELSKLIYYSTASEHCDSTEIEKILLISREMNSHSDISGVFYFSNHYFMEYLEGDKANVEDTYARITKDNRHTNIHLLENSTIETREFAGWAMAYIPQSDLIKPINMKYMNSAEFDPVGLSPADAMSIVLELHAQLPAVYYSDSTH